MGVTKLWEKLKKVWKTLTSIDDYPPARADLAEEMGWEELLDIKDAIHESFLLEYKISMRNLLLENEAVFNALREEHDLSAHEVANLAENLFRHARRQLEK